MEVESGGLEGRVLAGKYAVLSVIGRGAMGVVYRARQIALDKIVALKVLSNELRDDPEFVMRFHTEARAASRLDHPNSTRVLDFGEEPDGLLYIAMELLQGQTLAELVAKEFPLSPERVASIMSQTLSAVGAAHGLQILHRDLKPENIVILAGHDDEERHVDVVKVCDFGIAKLDGAADPNVTSTDQPKLKNATSAGVIVGTPQYMSPEQAQGEKLDVRSDLYSLGVVLYEVLTKRAPFDEGTPAEVLYKHAFVEPPPPSALHAGVDKSLEAICLRALRKRREERFATAREMRMALRSLTRDQAPPEIVPAPTPSAPAFDASAPTISATAITAAPKLRSARALWLLPFAVIGAVALGFSVLRRPHQSVAAPSPLSVSSTVAETRVARVESNAPDIVPTVRLSHDTVRPHVTHVETARSAHVDTAALQSQSQSQSEPIITAPPPPPPVVTTAPVVVVPPPVTTTTTTPPPDPARVHVDIGAIHADRVNVGSVESSLRHVDFTSCYRVEVAAARLAAGTATLALEMDEQSVTRADLSGGAFATTLRQCIVRRVVGTRVPNVDTGDATAKVTLRFFLQ